MDGIPDADTKVVLWLPQVCAHVYTRIYTQVHKKSELSMFEGLRVDYKSGKTVKYRSGWTWSSMV